MAKPTLIQIVEYRTKKQVDSLMKAAKEAFRPVH
jgi:hypothetical protein